MFDKQETEVLVVGAGPVGQFAALRLAEMGISAAIIDQQPRPAARSYALAIHPGSLRLLAASGLASELLERGHRVERVAFYDGDRCRAAVDFGRLPGAYPFLLVLPQQVLEEALERRLRALGVEVKWRHRLAQLDAKSEDATATIEQLRRARPDDASTAAAWMVDKRLRTRASFIIGADSHRSAVREALDLAFPEVGPCRFYAVFEFNADHQLANEVRVVVDGETTSVLWPLGGGRFRWSFELPNTWEFVPSSRSKRWQEVELGGDTFPYLDADKLQQLVSERAPWFEAKAVEITWSVAVRFEQRLAERFGRGQVWLAGDAAHLASPIGVGSMNAGLHEVDVLAKSIHRIQYAMSGPELLETYGATALREWRRRLALEGGLIIDPVASDWVRRRSQQLASCLPAGGNELELLLEQLGLHWMAEAPRAATRAD